VHNDPSKLLKDDDFGTNRKRVWDFRLVLNSNLGPALLSVSEMLLFLFAEARKPLFHTPQPISAKFSGCSFAVDP